MALMLRTLEVPTRNVTGFAGATYNRFGGFYAVRQGDAHSWVEVWLDDSGWRRFDPTPSTAPITPTRWTRWTTSIREVIEATSQRWNRHVERYDLRQQIELLSSLNRQFASVTKAAKWSDRLSSSWWLLGGVPIVVWAIRRLNKRRSRPTGSAKRPDPRLDQIVRLYQSLERQLEHLGIGRPSSTPPLAHAQALLALGHPVAQEALDLTKRYLAVRFGSEPFDLAAAEDFAKRVAELKRLAEPRQTTRAA
jgi:hypothetical protein